MPPTTSSSERKTQLRDVATDDLSVFFEHQRDPAANEMAAFPPRGRDAFMAHWKRIMADESVLAKTILVDDCIASWSQDGRRLVGYWIGKAFWGQGVATRALSEFVRAVKGRPLHAYVAKHNVASIRVLEKCGFAMCIEETGVLYEPADGVEKLDYSIYIAASDKD